MTHPGVSSATFPHEKYSQFSYHIFDCNICPPEVMWEYVLLPESVILSTKHLTC